MRTLIAHSRPCLRESGKSQCTSSARPSKRCLMHPVSVATKTLARVPEPVSLIDRPALNPSKRPHCVNSLWRVQLLRRTVWRVVWREIDRHTIENDTFYRDCKETIDAVPWGRLANLNKVCSGVLGCSDALRLFLQPASRKLKTEGYFSRRGGRSLQVVCSFNFSCFCNFPCVLSDGLSQRPERPELRIIISLHMYFILQPEGEAVVL